MDNECCCLSTTRDGIMMRGYCFITIGTIESMAQSISTDLHSFLLFHSSFFLSEKNPHPHSLPDDHKRIMKSCFADSARQISKSPFLHPHLHHLHTFLSSFGSTLLSDHSNVCLLCVFAWFDIIQHRTTTDSS